MQSYQQTQLVRRRRRRLAERQSRVKRRLGQGLWGITLLLAVFSLLGVVGLGAAYVSINSSLPNVEVLPGLLNPQTGSLLQPTRIYDRTGEHLLAALENSGIQRRFLSLNAALPESISPVLAQTVVLVLEPDYWDETILSVPDWDTERPLTIAERLARDLLLSGELSDGFYRLRLRLLAKRLLDRYGRAQVLEWYVNSASFGHLAYGIDSAARLYLGKPASQVDWFESAQLAALLDSPALNPLDAPAAAHERQLEVLARMTTAGLITLADFETAAAWPPLTPPPQPRVSTDSAAFTALVIDQVTSMLDQAQLERGGLRILTTLDYDLQQQLNCTVRSQLTRLEGLTTLPIDGLCPAADLLPAVVPMTGTSSAGLAASAVMLDPRTGQVLALAGDTTLTGGEGMMNRHPSGTLLTPVLALAGFARGLSPASLVWDIPVEADVSLNGEGAFHGPARFRTALTQDYSAALLAVYQQVGAAAVTTTAYSLGLTSFTLPEGVSALNPGPSLNPLEAAQAFSVFSTLGSLTGVQLPEREDLSPQLVLSIQNAQGEEISDLLNTQTRPVVSPQLAYLVQDILSDGLSSLAVGTGNSYALDRPAGAKIGNAASARSTWISGYTPQIVTAVWLGYPQVDETTPTVEIDAAAGIWHALTQYVSKDQPVLGWEMPAGLSLLEVCDPSGLLPTAECPNSIVELFLDENLPRATDHLYQRFDINRETGRLATIFTPPELVEASTFLVVPPEAVAWSRLANLPLPPTEYDNIQPVEILPSTRIVSPAQASFVRGKVALRGTASGEGFVSYRLQLGRGIYPTAWQNISPVMSSPVENGLLGELDTVGLNGLYIVRLMTVYEGQKIQLAYLQLTVDNSPPVVRIPYPLPGQVFSGLDQRTVTLQAEVEDAVGVQRVEWWLDGAKIGERNMPPYALIWDGKIGKHVLQVRAIDMAGNESRSEMVEITVQ